MMVNKYVYYNNFGLYQQWKLYGELHFIFTQMGNINITMLISIKNPNFGIKEKILNCLFRIKNLKKWNFSKER